MKMTAYQATYDGTMEYVCNLSARLFKSSNIFEHRINDHWVLFAPDWPGFPVVVNDWVHRVLDRFQEGSLVSDVLSELQTNQSLQESFDATFPTISFLEERGFLRDAPSCLPYQVPTGNSTAKPHYFGVWLHINNNCNLACSYCFVKEKSHTAMSTEVIRSTARAIANTAKLYGVKRVGLKFAGGEPTLVVPLMETFQDLLLEELRGTDVELHTAVLSNGTILNQRLLSFLKRPNTCIGISLDGYGTSHDIFRVFKNSRKGSWKTIMQNIEILREHSITPFIMATISAETNKSLPQLVKWIYRNNFKTRLSVVRQPNCSWNCSSQQVHEYKLLCDTMKDAFERAFVELEDPSFLIDLRVALRICELHFENPANGVPCGIGETHLVIKPNGNLARCPMTIDETGVAPSNDLLSSCRECFTYSFSQRKYESLDDECLNCKWFPVCAGGCPITNLRINGHPFTKSPLCDFYKYIIPRYLIFFGRKLLHAADKAEHMQPSIIKKSIIY
ncbi:hypothetical protein BEH94_07525 [Candidatus Altiarchaeales archaeon WOR_SM1_SCG]|nr:hypothetical protein BEH94_07525 [Candidatus Altiarchaeales archaeon WOR_SM1_SCG]